jgi:hypothetical protein
MALGSTKKIDDIANDKLTGASSGDADQILRSFDDRFAAITKRSLELIAHPRFFDATDAFYFHIARSAAEIEKAFGGITVRLWDDPFEWTLPEHLSTAAAIADYIRTADETRRRGMEFIQNDAQLFQLIPAPSELKPIFDVLLDAILRSEFEFGAAVALAVSGRLAPSSSEI